MNDFREPTAVVDIDKVRKNIRRMKRRLDVAGVRFRPHFKTHQSADIGKIFAEEGIQAITVSSVTMAHYFARAGWKDITIAFPLNLRELDRILSLPDPVVPGLLISDPQTAAISLPQPLLKRAVFWIELDTGHGRSGLPAADFPRIHSVVKSLLQAGASLKGFLFHDGHTYVASSIDVIRSIRLHTLRLIADLKDFLRKQFPGQSFVFSGGDTPSCSHDLPMEGIDEMRPGNFVFYDLQQLLLGSCLASDIALSVYCPVVASYPKQHRAVIYGGAIHLSKDKMTVNGQTIYGLVCSEEMQSALIPPPLNHAPFLTSLSQEHGVISGNPEQIRGLIIGTEARIIPVHSCLVVSQMSYLVSKDGIIFETLGGQYRRKD
ncbi:MAG: alanine racemase [Bacteroidales bacterium]